MEINTISINPQVQRIELSGEFDLANKDHLELVLNENLGQGHSLVIDLRKTKFFDSSVLHVFINAYQRAQKRNQKLVLLRGDTYAARILEISGLDKLLPVVQSESEAQDFATKGLVAQPSHRD